MTRIARVELPNGKVGEFDVPDGAHPQEIEAQVAEWWPSQQGSEPAERSVAGDIAASIGGGFNRGLAKTLGAPVDLVTAGLNMIPGVHIEHPVGGSESIEGGLRTAGMMPDIPHPYIGRVAEEVGAAAVPFGAVGAVARTAAEGGRLAKPVLEAFRRTPRLNAAGELSSATGAGVGAATANEIAPDDPTAELVGQILGGFANPMAVATDAARGAGRVKRVVEPYLPGGARRSAAKQLSGLVEDPDAAARALSREPDAVPGAKLTPAQETGDRNLLALERALGKGRGDVGQRLEDAAQATQRAAQAELEDIGAGSRDEPRAYLSGRLAKIGEDIDSRINRATQNAQEKISALAPSTPPEQLSRIARESLESALASERAREAALWAHVPDDVPTSTAPLRSTYEEIRGGLKKAETDDMPAFLDEMVGQNGRLAGTEPLGEVQAFRSKLLREIRRERAQDVPNRRRLAILERMQDSSLEAMQASQAGPKLDEAIAFSRQLNERFTQGPVGRILGHERRGGLTVAPEKTLDRLLARDGIEGMVNREALMKATDSPEMRGSVEDFIRHRFVMQATRADGKVQPIAAMRFLQTNAPLLEKMPAVQAQLERAVSAQDLASRTQNRLLARSRGLMDKRKSRAALYLDAPVGREIRSLLNSKDPKANLRELVRQTSGDLTGTARKGLKAQFVDEMLQSAEKGGRVSGAELDAFLKTHRSAMLESGLFSHPEMLRIQRVRDTLQRLEKQTARGRNIEDLLDESPDAITDLVARVIGANIGSHTATAKVGAPLVAAHAGSKFARRLTNLVPFERTRDVLAEAILDRNVMRDLLERVPNAPKSHQMARRMNAWLVNLVPEDERRQMGSEPILRSGKPYQTRKAAELAAKGRRLKGHIPQRVDGGWALVPGDQE